LLRYDGHDKIINGAESATTNNRMELRAAIEALALLKRPVKASITTDSQYLRQGILQWMAGWKRNGWKTSQRQPVKNRDLWERLDELTRQHEVEWHWVKGHSGHVENELVDAAANQAIDAMLAGTREEGA
jgi:ribonuclease HI